MNYDLVKSALLEIMKEAKNLPETELETIPGTNVKVKKGKAKEFDVNAYFYFQYDNNVIVDEKINYVTEVYKKLENEIKEENNEYYISKAYETISDVKDKVRNFAALKGSLATVKKDHNLKDKELKKLDKRTSDNAYLQKEIDELRLELEEEIKTLIKNQESITEQLISIKKEVNNNLLNIIEEQMADLRRSYLNTLNGTSRDFGLDNEAILASDKEEYDSLYILAQILKVANAKDDINSLVNIDNIMFINDNQKDTVEKILPNINLFKFTKRTDQESIISKDEDVHEPKEYNSDLILKITDELRRLEVKREKHKKASAKAKNGQRILINDLDEYNNLLEVLKYLHKAKYSKYEPIEINENIYIIPEDEEEFKKLVNNIKFFDEINFGTKNVDKNEELINELLVYLDKLATKVIEYKGVTNLPIKSTKQFGDKAWIVTSADIEEANHIIDIITLLQKSGKNKVSVWNIGSVLEEDKAKFKSLVNATNYFGSIVPDIEENAIEIDKTREDIKTLVINARQSNESKVVINGLEILDKDLEEYELLMKKYAYLQAANASDDLIILDNVKIDKLYVMRYQKIIARLEEIRTNATIKEVEPVKVATLPETIESTNNAISQVELDSNSSELNSSPLNAINSNDIKNVEDLKPNSSHNKVEEVLDNDLQSNNEMTLKERFRRKVKAIRKPKAETLKALLENKKVIIAVGLSLIVATIGAYNLIAPMIYVNSLTGFPLLNSLNKLLCMIGPVKEIGGAFVTNSGTVLNINMTVGRALMYMVQALAGAGLISASFITASKYIKNEEFERLPDVNTKKKVIDGILELGKELKNNLGNLKENIEEKVKDIKESNEIETLEQDNSSELDEKNKSIKERIEERIAKINSSRQSSSYEETYVETPEKLGDEIIKNEPVKPVIVIPNYSSLLDDLSDKKLVVAQTDNYIEAIKNGEKVKQYRDAVFAKTGIDLDDYDMSDYSSLVKARSDVAYTVNLDKEALIQVLTDKIKKLQDQKDSGLLTTFDMDRVEVDIYALNNYIDELKKNERGM